MFSCWIRWSLEWLVVSFLFFCGNRERFDFRLRFSLDLVLLFYTQQLWCVGTTLDFKWIWCLDFILLPKIWILWWFMITQPNVNLIQYKVCTCVVFIVWFLNIVIRWCLGQFIYIICRNDEIFKKYFFSKNKILWKESREPFEIVRNIPFLMWYFQNKINYSTWMCWSYPFIGYYQIYFCLSLELYIILLKNDNIIPIYDPLHICCC
jgi:hypothetical protein